MYKRAKTEARRGRVEQGRVGAKRDREAYVSFLSSKVDRNVGLQANERDFSERDM